MDEKDEKGLAIQIPCLISLAALNRMFWKYFLCGFWKLFCAARPGGAANWPEPQGREKILCSGGGQPRSKRPNGQMRLKFESTSLSRGYIELSTSDLLFDILPKNKWNGIIAQNSLLSAAIIFFWEICNTPKVTITVMTFWFEADLRLWELAACFWGRFRNLVFCAPLEEVYRTH